MGASSSCCFFIGKEKKSPCTENDGVAELGLVGAEGASTSGRTEWAAKTDESPSTAVDAVAENDGVAELGLVGAEGASTSGRTESIPKTDESPSTKVDAVTEVQAMAMVGAEGASTSGRSEYYSKGCEAMMRSRGKFFDDVALEIEFSSSHWSEVSRLEVAPLSAKEEELNRENRELLKQLEEEYSFMFRPYLRDYGLGRMIAKGGQAEIYEVVGHPDFLMKVFERGTSLRDLRRSWPLPILNKDVQGCIYIAGMLEDDRFAFLMDKCWGDLRKLIDQAMEEKNVDGTQNPPFPYKWKDYKRWTFYPIDFMLKIAEDMRDLHEKSVSHRDLKASNILLRINFRVEVKSYFQKPKGIVVVDFECSIGVWGTGFWRVPEILSTLGNASVITNEQWKKADVYSYSMICFEIVTGQIPFDGELGNTTSDCQLVIEGKRPQLPNDLHHGVKRLITKCWAPDPRLQPTFSQIVKVVERISLLQCQFKLFDINEKLPPRYHLAMMQEVNDYPMALMKAMPGSEIAKLANGSINGYDSGMTTRLVRQSDTLPASYFTRYKLARFHY